MIHQLPLTFLASSDASTEVAVIDGPPGSSLEQTRVLAERARKLLATVPEVQSVYTTIGAGVPTGNIRSDMDAAEANQAKFTTPLSPPKHTPRNRHTPRHSTTGRSRCGQRGGQTG